MEYTITDRQIADIREELSRVQTQIRLILSGELETKKGQNRAEIAESCAVHIHNLLCELSTPKKPNPDEQIIVTLTISKRENGSVGVEYNLKNMVTLMDAFTVANVLGDTRGVISQILCEKMPEEVKKMDGMTEEKLDKYMRETKLNFQI